MVKEISFQKWQKTESYLWCRVGLWCLVIFSLSAIPDYDGGVPDFETAFGLFRFASRKMIHLVGYAVLGIFFRRALSRSAGQTCRWPLLATLGFCVLYAVTDEWHQTFVYGRSGNGMDVFVDAAGTLMGQMGIRYKP